MDKIKCIKLNDVVYKYFYIDDFSFKIYFGDKLTAKEIIQSFVDLLDKRSSYVFIEGEKILNYIEGTIISNFEIKDIEGVYEEIRGYKNHIVFKKVVEEDVKEYYLKSIKKARLIDDFFILGYYVMIYGFNKFSIAVITGGENESISNRL